ncbi:MAG: TetR-like C-terminal domain-containing protein [Pseudomonadota bacterium]
MAARNSASLEGDTRALLTKLLRNAYARFVDGQAQSLFRILITEGDRIPDVIAAYHAMTIKRGATLLQAILKRGIARGEVRDSAILSVPNVIMAPAVYFSVHNMMFQNAQPLELESYFEAHIELVLNGILTPPDA